MSGFSYFEIFPPNFLYKTMLAGPLHGPGYDFSCLILLMLEEIALTFSSPIPYYIRVFQQRTRQVVLSTFYSIPFSLLSLFNRGFLINLKDMGSPRKVVAKNNT